MADFTPSTASANAPHIEAGWYDLEFLRTEGKTVKGGKYQKNPDGDPKLEWFFNALGEDGEVLYDEGDPIEVSKLTGVTFNLTATTESAQLKLLRAMLTKAERKAYDEEGIAPQEAQLKGRKVYGEVFIKEDGWPGIGTVIPARGK